MVHLLPSPVQPSLSSHPLPYRVRAVRPSLLDQRFVGDPWVVDHGDGTASLRLDDYLLTTVCLCAFDLPALNRAWTDLRQRSRLCR